MHLLRGRNEYLAQDWWVDKRGQGGGIREQRNEISNKKKKGVGREGHCSAPTMRMLKVSGKSFAIFLEGKKGGLGTVQGAIGRGSMMQNRTSPATKFSGRGWLGRKGQTQSCSVRRKKTEKENDSGREAEGSSRRRGKGKTYERNQKYSKTHAITNLKSTQRGIAPRFLKSQNRKRIVHPVRRLCRGRTLWCLEEGKGGGTYYLETKGKNNTCKRSPTLGHTLEEIEAKDGGLGPIAKRRQIRKKIQKGSMKPEEVYQKKRHGSEEKVRWDDDKLSPAHQKLNFQDTVKKGWLTNINEGTKGDEIGTRSNNHQCRPTRPNQRLRKGLWGHGGLVNTRR